MMMQKTKKEIKTIEDRAGDKKSDWSVCVLNPYKHTNLNHFGNSAKGLSSTHKTS